MNLKSMLKPSFFLTILTLVLAACGQAPTAPSRPVVVRPQTKVLDAAARQALREFQPDGTLVFSGTPAFKPGQVLVSQPSAAAPEGLLRKVIGLEQVGSQTRVRTAQAQLGDAIQKGKLSIEQELKASDLRSASMNRQGVRLMGFDEDGLRVGIDVLISDTDENEETKDDRIVASGELKIKPVIKVDLDLDCGPACLYDNDLDFMAQIGIKQVAAIKISGKGIYGAHLKKTFKLASFDFGPYTFFIGPVPVVITPKIVLELRFDGTLGVNISYQVSETLTAVAGAKYDDGWKNISELDMDFDAGPVDLPFFFTPTLEVKAKLALRGELVFYGVVGPTIEIAPFVHIDLKYPRDPIWKINGGIEGNVGIKIDLLGYSKHYQANLWDNSIEIKRSDNAAPEVKFISPSTPEVDLNLCCTLRVEARDAEDGNTCCTVSIKSSNPEDGNNGDLGQADSAQPDLTYRFITVGERTLTATTTDSKGKSATTTATINVINTPPTVAITSPFSGQQFFRGVKYTLRRVSYDPNEENFLLPCSNLSWTSDFAGDPTVSGCGVNLSFASNGARTLTLTGTDVQGQAASTSVVVSVMDPPANLPPLVNLANPQNFTAIGPTSVLQLVGSATDPEGGPVTLSWDVTTGYNLQTGQGLKTYPVNPAANGNWKPTDSIPYPSGCGLNDTLRLRLKAKDNKGNEGSDFVVLKVDVVC